MYALMYLMRRITSAEMNSLREFNGLPPYPSHNARPDIVDYSTSIEGLGACAVIADAYESIVQQDQLGCPVQSIHHAVVGDGELTELQIGGSLYEAPPRTRQLSERRRKL
jgi:pyruvate dehydrogenase E1 component